jgi:hypothetical protein
MRKTSIAVASAGALALALGAASPALASVSGTERFTVVETSPTGSNFPLSATGPIHASGTDHVVSDHLDRFSFSQGSLLIRHTPTSHTQRNDPKACTFRFTEQGTYRVLSGTGAYKDATGNGTYRLSGIIIGCDPKKPPRASSIIINAAGPLKF